MIRWMCAAALGASLAMAPSASAAATHVFKPAKAGKRAFTFRVAGLADEGRIVRAKLVRGDRRKRLRTRRVRRAADKGALRVKRRRWRKPARARTKAPKLKVKVKKTNSQKPPRKPPPAVPKDDPHLEEQPLPVLEDPPPVVENPAPVAVDVPPAVVADPPPVVVIPEPEEPTTLFSDSFTAPDGVLTNHYAFWSPHDNTAFRSPNWEMESGCAFIANDTLWTGIPTSNIPNRDCSNGSGSEVFRLWTKRNDFGDVKVTFSLRNNGYVSGAQGERSWDGIKIWLRRQGRSGSHALYTAEVNRRQGNLMIQKKCAGSPDYRILGQNRPAGAAAQIGQWETVGGRIRNLSDGSVEIELIRRGETVLTARDTGGDCPPITSAGRVGVRGDYTNFNVDNFLVTPAS